MFSIKIKDFDFEKTFHSGLFYFFYGHTPERKIISGRKLINLSFSQKNNSLCVDGGRSGSRSLREGEKKLIKKRLRYCFGADEDMSEFYSLCSRDRVLKDFLPRIKGTRIISAYSDFEALVGAVVSQNNSYTHYRRQMFKLYEKLNFNREKYLGNLEKLRLGYKSAYIKNLASNYGKIPLAEIKGIGAYSLNLLNYGKIPLAEIKGIGAYSLNLFEIFQKRNYGAFYIDCLLVKIMRESYHITSGLDNASKKLWGPWRGLALAYLQRFFEQKPQNK